MIVALNWGVVVGNSPEGTYLLVPFWFKEQQSGGLKKNQPKEGNIAVPQWFLVSYSAYFVTTVDGPLH